MRKGTTNKKPIRISKCRMILRNSFLIVQAVKGKEVAFVSVVHLLYRKEVSLLLMFSYLYSFPYRPRHRQDAS